MPAVSGVTADGRMPQVVVTVGTDHHPFDRLVLWVNHWLERHPEQTDAFFVQTGTSTVVPRCPSDRFLDTGRLDELLQGAQTLVCHGGPASIADAWQRGHIPIVVPRERRRREHVDDHQVDFTARVAKLGRIRLPRTEAEFAALLEAGSSKARVGPVGADAHVKMVTDRFAALVDNLVRRDRRPPSVLNLARRVRTDPEASR